MSADGPSTDGPSTGGPLYAWYGDDFTGSTDVLEQLAEAGVPAVLFLGPPTPERLARFAGVHAVGVAGDSRSRPPAWMDAHLPGLFGGLKALGAPVTHYKVCSTFDSSPERGSIGRAMELGRAAFGGGLVPIVVGAPHLRRYVAFGNLFAAAGGAEVFRIDRHPTMSRHPATPMHEADLRAHLAAQTPMPIALADLPTLKSGRGAAALEAAERAGAQAVLFDGVDEASLAAAGALVAAQAERAPLFAVGSSGLTRALIAEWRARGLLDAPPAPPSPGPVPALLVVSGSCSPTTARQIERALAQGYAGVPADPARLLDPETGAAAQDACVAAALEALARGQSPLVHSAAGPLPAGAEPQGDALGQALGRILRRIVERSGIRRVVAAGGDTSSHAIAQLDAYALTYLAPADPGAPLCRLWSDDPALDGLELVLKGGQMGGEDAFERVRLGRAR